MSHDLPQTALRLSTAPMMDWTDRHCLYLFRLILPDALLYTEMITSGAIFYGDRGRFLDFHACRQPLALQLGGSDPAELAAAIQAAEAYDFAEYNLNCGCPSDRVQKGAFGACLMANPQLVADCVKAMQDQSERPVTIKCRIGIDDAPEPGMLNDFVGTLRDAGIHRFIIHARKAWLNGLSPKQNRTIPPLRYDLVTNLKRLFPELTIIINGGITQPAQAVDFIEAGLDGVMLGRHAYDQPMSLLAFADALTPNARRGLTLDQVLAAMAEYAETVMGTHNIALGNITRHMLGLAHGRPGARRFRRLLGEEARARTATPDLIRQAAQLIGAFDQAA